MVISKRIALPWVLFAAFFCATGLRAQGSPSGSESQNEAIRKAEGLRDQAKTTRQSQTKKELALARSLYEQSARLFEAGGAREPAAEAYLEAADISILFSQYREAREAYRQVMRLGASEAQCKAKSRTARIYATTGPVALADSTSSEAAQFCHGLGQRAETEALEAQGEVLESAGQHAESAELLEQAARSFDAMGDQEGKAESLLMLAAALYSVVSASLSEPSQSQEANSRLRSAITKLRNHCFEGSVTATKKQVF